MKDEQGKISLELLSRVEKPRKTLSELLINFALFYAILYSLFIIPYIFFINRIVSFNILMAYISAVFVYVIFWAIDKWRFFRDGINN